MDQNKKQNAKWIDLPALHFLREHRFLFFTYLVILFIPLAVSVFYTANVDAIMRRDAYLRQKSALQREKLFCDSILRGGKEITSAIATHIDTTHLARRASLSPADRWKVYTLTSFLSNMLHNNSFIDSLGIYFYKNDSFITDNGRYVPVLYSTCLTKYGLTPEAFLSATSGFRGFFTARSEEETYLILYQNIFNDSYKERSAIAYAVIPWAKIWQKAAYLEPEADEEFFLLTRGTALFGESAPPQFRGGSA